jgi:hypothetical protein
MAIPAKFFPVDLQRYRNASPDDLGPRSRAKEFSPDGLIRTPPDLQRLRGIPFLLAPEQEQKQWLVLSGRESPWTSRGVEVPIQRKAAFLCLAQFCDWIPTPVHDAVIQRPFGMDGDSNPADLKKVGQVLADAILIYEDGERKAIPVRRYFEVNAPSTPWNEHPFAAVRHYQTIYEGAPAEQHVRTGALQRNKLTTDRPRSPVVWLCALPNPAPERTLKSLRIESRSEDLLIICGLTLFEGRENPLRYDGLQLYRLTLPEDSGDPVARWKLDVDLGVVTRTYELSPFEPAQWMSEPDKGLGRFRPVARPYRHLYAEITASPEATLSVLDTKSGKRYEFDLGKVTSGAELEPRSNNIRLEVLERNKAWLHGTVVDSGTQRPTPVRLAFRSAQGKYIPPYGHCEDNDIAMTQMYSPDLRMGDDCFAYVDGSFQIELPVGEVYIEITKGFEYEPARKKLTIQPGQREIKLEISRFTNLRAEGWITADSHVHFLSPSTAVLEAQAEGLNVVNLLVTQWGNLFSNVGDVSEGSMVSRDGSTVVKIGSENRHHVLGHLSFLGTQSDPVYPLSVDGPNEGSIGSLLWSGLSEMAEACRKRGGLAIAAHLPAGFAEAAAGIVSGHLEAVELAPYRLDRPGSFDLIFYDWYHCLNCGYRLPVLGGSDKMGTYMPVGANRTYAYLGQEEFSFANWAKAVRKGNTFATTGPLLLFSVDGKAPGDEIRLGAGGGSLQVQVEARSFVPFERIEIIHNGRVVAFREAREGTREMAFREKLRLAGPGWLAARCSSRLWWPPAPGNLIFAVAAHTSPVYLVAPGQDLLSAASASYLLNLMDGAQSYVKNLATRPDPERLAQIVRTFEEARAKLHRRLHEHGIRPL